MFRFATTFLALLSSLASGEVWPDLDIGSCRGDDVLPCWQDRVVYQIITDRFARSNGSNATCTNLADYCGGSFRGIMDNLDYIQGLQVDAIWISPVVAQVQGGYHGYWASSLTEINPHFGTADDLKALIAECHRRGLLVMVDVVANHMGQTWDQIAQIEPFNSPEYYHDCSVCMQYGGGKGGVGCNGTICDCWVYDYEVPEQELYCQLDGMPDLNQSHPFVREQLLAFARNLTLLYGFDALRIDTVPYVPKSFWKAFDASAGLVFSMGEVSTHNDTRMYEYVKKSASVYNPYKPNAMDATINYPLYYELLYSFFPAAEPEHFANGSVKPRNRTFWRLSNLVHHQRFLYGDYVVPLLGNFAECHDTERLQYYSDDLQLRRGMYLYVLAAEGIPLILYGMDQDFTQANRTQWGFDSRRPPLWEHNYSQPSGAYNWIATVNGLRSKMPRIDFATAKQFERFVSDDLFIFQRGLVMVALTNGGSGYKRVSQVIQESPWSAGERVCNVFEPSTDCAIVGHNGTFEVVLLGGESKLYAPEHYVKRPQPAPKGFLAVDAPKQSGESPQPAPKGFLAGRA